MKQMTLDDLGIFEQQEYQWEQLNQEQFIGKVEMSVGEYKGTKLIERKIKCQFHWFTGEIGSCSDKYVNASNYIYGIKKL